MRGGYASLQQLLDRANELQLLIRMEQLNISNQRYPNMNQLLALEAELQMVQERIATMENRRPPPIEIVEFTGPFVETPRRRTRARNTVRRRRTGRTTARTRRNMGRTSRRLQFRENQ